MVFSLFSNSAELENKDSVHQSIGMIWVLGNFEADSVIACQQLTYNPLNMYTTRRYHGTYYFAL